MSGAGKRWGGVFSEASDPAFEAFSASVRFDHVLAGADIEGSRIQAEALAEAGVISTGERRAILDGLDAVAREVVSGELAFPIGKEDVHTVVEDRLIELVGEPARRLHTGRSRNDQVVLDEKLYLREAADRIDARIRRLQRTLLDVSEREIDALMPGYTHLRPAQPVRFSHYLLALFWMLERDRGRLANGRHRMNTLPLGAGALAGTPFAIDRAALAQRFGFARASENSIDAVSDRDFIAEFLSFAATFLVHLSRFAGDLIRWSGAEYGFVRLHQSLAGGSSQMPQKINPDSLEHIRGKTGRIAGALVTVLMAQKGVPLAYSGDLQEDKEPLFDAIATAEGALTVFERIMATLEVDASRMRNAITPELLTTDLAFYLVNKDVPFREAHEVVGALVHETLAQGRSVGSLSTGELRAAHPAFGQDALDALDPERAVEARDSEGGTSRRAVLAQIAAGRALVGSDDTDGA